MNMMGKADHQKYFSGCLLKSPFFLFLVTLVPPTAFFCFLSSYRLFSLLITTTVLFISSTVLIVKFSKKKIRVCLDEKPVQEENPSFQTEEDVSATVETQTQPCDAQAGEAGLECELTDLPSDTETSSGTVASEDFELDWLSSSHIVQKGSVCDVSSCSDDDDDDDDVGGGGDDDDDDDDDGEEEEEEEEEEDGLIEIALVNDSSNGLCEEPKHIKKQNLQSFWVQDSVHYREEEIDDVNIEEENLIEIDISMGSIKRQTAEI